MDAINNLINELISLLDKKAELFSSIMDVTVQQKKDIFENEAGNVEELVSRKQAVIDKVDEIDSVFSDKLKMLKKSLNISSLEGADFTKYPVLKTLKLKVESIMEAARKIMDIEKENREKLLLMHNELKKELKQINIGKKSVKAYERPVISSDGIYIDRKK